MEEPEKQTEETKEVEQKPTKSKNKLKPLVILLALLLIGGAAAAAYLVKDKNDALKAKDDKIALLEGASVAVEDYTDADVAGDTTPTATCEGGSSYTADIGKFELTLDSPRVIIRDLDAGFEGGPITQLEIGACTDAGMLVVDTPPQNEVSIIGHPSSSSTDLRGSYESQNGALTPDGSITIAGVSAERFTLSGLFETTVLYFDNEGIGYQIELSDTNAVTNATLNDITNDWSFTP